MTAALRPHANAKPALRPQGGTEPALPWIGTRPGIPYFLGDDGTPWTPIGQNDAIGWPELSGLFRRRDLAGVEAHLRWLKARGVTCLRLMLEYCQGEHRYIERPVGRFVPNMVRLWDDLFALLETVGLHVLLTPYDTFFQWRRWQHHPYNAKNGGPCAARRQLVTCPATREAIKARLAFASDRWGGSPALFAWDIWNEMHPAHGGDDPGNAAPFIDDVAVWLRAFEIARHGRAHLQTVSVFGPELLRHPVLVEPIFRHPALDFANTHLYESGTIDSPRDTVAPAIATGRLIRTAVIEASDMRPVFDSEHGPIHTFKDRKKTLPADFDDEYFRHMQWAHVASGGAGGGMRWPNRHPHVLTPGMRAAQAALARVLPLIDWTRLRRRNLNADVRCDAPALATFACGDADQAIVWLLRTDTLDRRGMVSPTASPIQATLAVPGLAPGEVDVTLVDTRTGVAVGHHVAASHGEGVMLAALAVTTDLAVVLRRR